LRYNIITGNLKPGDFIPATAIVVCGTNNNWKTKRGEMDLIRCRP